ncbi:MAG: dihydrofolate reductase family protein [candidate division Zixibacteria bacterium]|nr:dihydrofolate reductase family protein [candidate division Zixibacteria bacterium]
MRKLAVFNNVSLDGYFTDKNNDMSWVYNVSPDAEWDVFVAGNASGEGVLLFGRKTYELMAGYWPTPMAAQQMPEVALGMNRMPKIVFSNTMDKASWNNTKLVKSDPAAEIRKMKKESGPDMVILGSGSIVAQLAGEGLIDEYQFVVVPVVLGGGRTMFEGVWERLKLKLAQSRTFRNGKVFLSYETAA